MTGLRLRHHCLVILCVLSLIFRLVGTKPVPYNHAQLTDAAPSLLPRVGHDSRSDTDLATRATLGWEFFVQIMFEDTDGVNAIIEKKFGLADDKNTNWQRDSDGAFISTSKSMRSWAFTFPQCNLHPIFHALQGLNAPVSTTCQPWIQSQAFYPRNLYAGPQIIWYDGTGSHQKTEATGAEITFSMDPDGKVITIVHAQSPLATMQQRRDNGQLPDNFNSLKGIPGLPRKPTVNCAGKCTPCKEKDFEKLSFGQASPTELTNNGRLSPWPGISVSVSDWAFDALLAPTNFKGLAWFLAQRKELLEHSTLSKVWVFHGDGDADNKPSVMWQLEPVTDALQHAAQERHKQGFAIGVNQGLRRAPADVDHVAPAQAGEGDEAEPARDTKRPADQAFAPQEGQSPGSGGGAAESGSSAGSPPYLDPGAPPYMPDSAAQTPKSGGQSSGNSHSGGSPGSGSGQDASPAGGGGGHA